MLAPLVSTIAVVKLATPGSGQLLGISILISYFFVRLRRYEKEVRGPIGGLWPALYKIPW